MLKFGAFCFYAWFTPAPPISLVFWGQWIDAQWSRTAPEPDVAYPIGTDTVYLLMGWTDEGWKQVS